MSNLATLGPYYKYQTSETVNGTETTSITVYGLITLAQSSTALGFLNTLNSALGFNVPCISYNVTSQP